MPKKHSYNHTPSNECIFCTKRFTQPLGLSRLKRHIFDDAGNWRTGACRLEPPTHCPICAQSLPNDNQQQFIEQFDVHLKGCLYTIPESRPIHVGNEVTAPSRELLEALDDAHATEAIIPDSPSTIQLQSEYAPPASVIATPEIAVEMEVEVDVEMGAHMNVEASFIAGMSDDPVSDHLMEVTHLLQPAETESGFYTAEDDDDESGQSSDEGSEDDSDDEAEDTSENESGITSDDGTDSDVSDSSLAFLEDENDGGIQADVGTSQQGQAQSPSNSTGAYDALFLEYEQAIARILDEAHEHVQQFWNANQKYRRKVALRELSQRIRHPFERVKYTTESAIKLELMQVAHECSLTEDAFRRIFTQTGLAQNAYVSIPDGTAADIPFTSFFSTLRALKTVARKFSRVLYNMQLKWHSETHPEQPAYTFLEGIVAGWLACAQTSECIKQVNEHYTLPYIEDVIRTDYDELKRMVTGEIDSGFVQPDTSYGEMHTGYNWLLSIKCIQDKWKPTYRACQERNIPVYFLHLLIFSDGFAAFSTKSKSLNAIVASAGEFSHAERCSGSLPTLMLQSLITKHHKENARSNANLTSLADVQTLLNLEYEGLNRGMMFYDANQKRKCCVIVVEHCVLGDGPGKAEYFGTSGYGHSSERGCPIAKCRSDDYLPQILDPAFHRVVLHDQETMILAENYKHKRITSAVAAAHGFKTTMPSQFTPGLPFFERQCPDIMHCDAHGNMEDTLELLDRHLSTHHNRNAAAHEAWWRLLSKETRRFCKNNGVPLLPVVTSFKSLCKNFTLENKANFPIYSLSSFLRLLPADFSEVVLRMWLVRVDHTALCMRHKMNQEDVIMMEELGQEVRQLILTNFGEDRFVMNMHMETHYALGIKRFGVLRETAVFGMENVLGYLKKSRKRNSNGKSICQKLRLDFLLHKAASLKLGTTKLPVRLDVEERHDEHRFFTLCNWERSCLDRRDISIGTGRAILHNACTINYQTLKSGNYVMYGDRDDFHFAKVLKVIKVVSDPNIVLLCQCMEHDEGPETLPRHRLHATDVKVAIRASEFLGRTLIDKIDEDIYAMHTIL